MPRYLHIPHTPDTARTLTLSGRNCLVVSGIVTPPKIGYRRGKGRRGEMCPQGTQKSHSGAAACLVAHLCVHASQKQYNYEEKDIDTQFLLLAFLPDLGDGKLREAHH